MNFISPIELKDLVEQAQGCCVSISMPVLVGADSQQNPVRFKNLLCTAESSLVDNGMDAIKPDQVPDTALLAAVFRY